MLSPAVDSHPARQTNEDASALRETPLEEKNFDASRNTNTDVSLGALSFSFEEEQKEPVSTALNDPAFSANKMEQLESLYSHARRASPPHPQRSGRAFVRYGIILVSLLVAALFILVSTRFARLTIFIEPREDQVTFDDIDATFDVEAGRFDKESRILPAQSFAFSQNVIQDFPAQGKAKVSEKSRGAVRIYNAFSSAPQQLIARTRFAAESGALFRLSKGVIVPGAKIEAGAIVPQFVEGELIADRAGEEGNIAGEIRLTIPGFRGTPRYDGFYAVASGGFSGGAEGERSVVSAEDLAAAEKAVTKAVYEALERDVKTQIPSFFVLADGLKEIEVKEIKKPAVGVIGDNFSVTARADARALAFRKEDVAALLSSVLLGSEGARAFIEGSEAVAYNIRDVNFEKGRARVTLQGSLKTTRVFSEEELAGVIAAQKEGSVIEILKRREEFSRFRLSFFPPWRFSAPSDPKRIRFVGE